MNKREGSQGMRSRLRRVLGMLAGGAALSGLQPGRSGADEVRARMGRPGHEWLDPDGSLTWEYSRQPEGVECFMVTIGADGRLAAVDNVLTAANFARVAPGWSREQVLRLLGTPRSRQRFASEEVWDWRLPADFSAENFFNVHFDCDGKVVRSSRSTQSRG